MEGAAGNTGVDDPLANDQNKIRSEGLRFVFLGNRDNFPSNPCTYYEDGNPDMYTKENMDKRKELQTNTVVREAIDEFINYQFTLDRSSNCVKEEYIKIFMKIGLILRPDIEAADLERIIKEDWELDSMDKMIISDEDREDPRKLEQAVAEFEAQPQKTYEQVDK